MRVEGTGFRVQGAEFRVQGLGFRVQGSGYGVSCRDRRAREDGRGWEGEANREPAFGWSVEC